MKTIFEAAELDAGAIAPGQGRSGVIVNGHDLEPLPRHTADTTHSGHGVALAGKILRRGGTKEEYEAAVHHHPETAGSPWANDPRQVRRAWAKACLDYANEHGLDPDFFIGLPQRQLKNGGEYGMRKIEWLWPQWIARGKLHIIGGQAGTGKSALLYSLAAAVTTISGKWPDGSQAPLGDVLIWSGEDDIEDTILPRIAVAGGDIRRVHFVDDVIVDGVKRSFDPATDIPILCGLLRELPDLQMIGIDPVVSASTADSHRNAETRRGLQPLVNLAEERRCALIGVTHFTKNTQGRDPIERITGTLAYGALPRVVMGVAKGVDEDAPRRIVRIKSNIGKTGGGFEYLLRQELVPGHDFTGQRIMWGAQLVGTAQELLADVETPQSAVLKAIVFLESAVTKDGISVKELKKAAEAHGFAWRTIERAKTKLPIVAKKLPDGWVWVLEEGFEDDEL